MSNTFIELSIDAVWVIEGDKEGFCKAYVGSAGGHFDVGSKEFYEWVNFVSICSLQSRFFGGP